MTDDPSATDEPGAANDPRAQVRAAFPAIERFQDEALREGVLRTWEIAMADNEVDDLAAVPWFPPAQAKLDLPDETLVDHVREVVDGSIALAETLVSARGDRLELSMDVLLAGALVHDVSKLYEHHGHEETPTGHFLGHPHAGVHPTMAAGLPAEVVQITLSHTDRTTVEPATLEAEIVKRADEVVAAAIRMRSLEDLRDA